MIKKFDWYIWMGVLITLTILAFGVGVITLALMLEAFKVNKLSHFGLAVLVAWVTFALGSWVYYVKDSY